MILLQNPSLLKSADLGRDQKCLPASRKCAVGQMCAKKFSTVLVKPHRVGFCSEIRIMRCDPILSTILSIGTQETYSFTYLANQPLVAPIGSGSFGTTHLLASIIDALNRPTTLQYFASNSGELEKVTFSQGGSLRWSYGAFTYSGSVTLREVQQRFLKKSSGASDTTYTFSHDPLDSGRTWRAWTKLDDPSGVGHKTWYFNASGAASALTSSFEQRATSAGAVIHKQDFTYVQDSAGNPYVSAVLTTLDQGTGFQKQSKNEQSRDSFGNLIWSKVYDYGNLTTPARTYNQSYLTGSNYSSRYINNRLVTSTVTDSSGTVTLVTNTYDAMALASVGTPRQHDASGYPTSMVYRGNVTQRVSFGKTQNTYYDQTGTVYSSNDNQGHSIAVTSDASKNYAVPSVITPNSNSNLATSLTYSSFLGVTSATQPNAAVAQTWYAGNGRVAQTQSVYGAMTTYSYVDGTTASVTATINGRWTKTTQDGLGRPIKIESGDAGGTKSTVDTEYGPCACSPMGKVKRVSQPYAPGGTVYWTTYTYDALGRTTRTDLPDGSFSIYVYEGNATTITDPAGKWKKYTTDALGNLTKVEEPNPAGGANLETLYTYDVLNKLKTVSMTRSSTTQTRTFVYNAN